uniref:Putative ovule protein n=1 Tax=Solanum chacoense TaxID=4108 RepID=A0A0V0HBI7_SOLCH
MMNYSTGNKTTTLININDVPHNVGEGFLYARTSRQTITTTTTVTPHVSIMNPISGSLSLHSI